MHSKSPYDGSSDAQLWLQLKEGDEMAFKNLFERYVEYLLRYGLTLSSDREFVKDNIQELFLELWKKRSSLSSVRNVKWYIVISFRNKVLNGMAIETKLLIKGADFLYTQSVAEEPNPAISPASDSDIHRVSTALYQLPARQREAIFLRFYEMLDYKQIEMVMGLSNQVVRNTLYRALQSLKATLKNSFSLLLVFM